MPGSEEGEEGNKCHQAEGEWEEKEGGGGGKKNEKDMSRLLVAKCSNTKASSPQKTKPKSNRITKNYGKRGNLKQSKLACPCASIFEEQACMRVFACGCY